MKLAVVSVDKVPADPDKAAKPFAVIQEGIKLLQQTPDRALQFTLGPTDNIAARNVKQLVSLAANRRKFPVVSVISGNEIYVRAAPIASEVMKSTVPQSAWRKTGERLLNMVE